MVYLVTNRAYSAESGGVGIFKDRPHPRGPNELRIFAVDTQSANGYQFQILPDELQQEEVEQLKRKYNLDIDETQRWNPGLRVACETFARARQEQKHVLFFVHGFNNDMKDVIDTVKALELRYPNQIVIPFSWPARGGGAVGGTLNYLDDKRDARVSSGALDRVIAAIRFYHNLMTEGGRKRLWEKCLAGSNKDREAARDLYVAKLATECKVSINLVCHSMGNYVLKYATKPSGAAIRQMTFDNVCLAAADVNNEGHADWVEAIDCRGRVYITINEDDYALQWSRRKPGEEQKARLGHYLRRLNADNGVYIDFTDSKGVGSSHSYFYDGVGASNPVVAAVFATVFSGQRPEPRLLTYQSSNNSWRLPEPSE